MRVEPFSVGSCVHVLKRGGRGVPFLENTSDYVRCVRAMYYMNDEFIDKNWSRNQSIKDTFDRPDDWPARDPLVKILCYILMPNHIHFVLKEIKEGGVSMFMKKFGQSMTNHFNEKYRNRGSIFQGSYRSVTISDDKYLRYVAAYVMVKNNFELFKLGGLETAVNNFDKAWYQSLEYPFSSLFDYAGQRCQVPSPVIDKDLLGEIFNKPEKLRSFAQDVIKGGKWIEHKKLSEFGRISIE